MTFRLHAAAELTVLVDVALKDGVRAVLDEFAPFLGEFSEFFSSSQLSSEVLIAPRSVEFPPRIATRLQLLVDWG